MKNLKSILIATLMVVGLSFSNETFAQTRQIFALKAVTQAGVGKATPDTTTNTDTTYLILPQTLTGTSAAIKPYNEYSDLVYSWSLVPGITGTTSGTVVLQGSPTGNFSRSSAPVSDWVNLTPSTAYSTSDSTSYTGAHNGSGGFGATQLHRRFVMPNNQDKYQRIRFISTGTQTSVITGSVSVLTH